MPVTDSKSYAQQEREKCRKSMDRILEALPEYCSRYLYNQLNGSKKMQPRTALAYAGDLRLFFHYLSVASPACRGVTARDIPAETLGKFNVDDMEEYMYWLMSYEKDGKHYTNTPESRRRKISTVSALYRFLVKKHYVRANPCELLDPMKVDYRPIVHLNDEDQKNFIRAVEGSLPGQDGKNTEKSRLLFERYTKVRNLAITYLFLGTGIRVSELVSLDLPDFNLNEQSFLVTRKGGEIKELYYGGDVAAVLNEYITAYREKLMPGGDSADRNALFFSLKHKRVTVRQVENIIKNAAVEVFGEKTKISPHKLRSTYGTRLLEASNSIALVAEILNHKDINMTKKRYSAVADTMKAAGMVKVKPE